MVGLTHQHYKYPARFSPGFARAAIQAFSSPDDLVLDPYMGGGTTIVEALAANRRVVGCDINSLGVFVTRAKTQGISMKESVALEAWVLAVSDFGYHDKYDVDKALGEERTRNLHLPRARALKKFIGFALSSSQDLPTGKARRFARCAILNVAQWALNGRKQAPTLQQFRVKLIERTFEMIAAAGELQGRLDTLESAPHKAQLIHGCASSLPKFAPFSSGSKADLVVTSPPYPGVHVLYHRWQVDGRRETPAPYWIAGCLDGKGDAFYNFGSRWQSSLDDYFDQSLATLHSIRKVVQDGAHVVQLIAFAEPQKNLPRYLSNMESAGFAEIRLGNRRTWRSVPGRSWHAEMKGETNSAREVVLIHRAV